MRLPRAALAAPLILLGALAAQACGGASPASEPKAAEPPAPSPAPTAGAPAAPAAATTMAPGSGNAPEISRSVGVAGGVVVLWPRIPGAKDPDARQIAARIQKRLAAIVQKGLPGYPVDVRPEPERVCPRSGCTALAVGAVLSKVGAGCAVTATVSGPGQSVARLVPWVGNIQLRNQTSPFRQPPEQEIAVSDYQSCGAVDGDLAGHEADVESAIRSAAGK